MGGKARPRAGGGEGDEDDASAARWAARRRPPADQRGEQSGAGGAGGQRPGCADAQGEAAASQAPPAQRSPGSRSAARGGARRPQAEVTSSPAGRGRRTAQALAAPGPAPRRPTPGARRLRGDPRPSAGRRRAAGRGPPPRLCQRGSLAVSTGRRVQSGLPGSWPLALPGPLGELRRRGAAEDWATRSVRRGTEPVCTGLSSAAKRRSNGLGLGNPCSLSGPPDPCRSLTWAFPPQAVLCWLGVSFVVDGSPSSGTLQASPVFMACQGVAGHGND